MSSSTGIPSPPPTIYDLGQHGRYTEAGIATLLATHLSLAGRESGAVLAAEYLLDPALVKRILRRAKWAREYRGKWEWKGYR